MPEIDRSDWPQAQALIRTGADFHARGWSLATSSNYSVVLSHKPLRILITASGKEKQNLTGRDFVVVDEDGRAVESGDNKPSAETLLHVVAAQHGGGAILHTHSVWATVLSDVYFSSGRVTLNGYEMQKAFNGITTHEQNVPIEIFENTQDIAALAEQVGTRFRDTERPLRHAFLIRRHGLYTWGKDLAEARRHIEALEFLFEVCGRTLQLQGLPLRT
ncbi:MAG TPA: methylthioribulose 1-phosphate dehydratase [Planctomycetota bacterium]|nr:methylthioribulose 1-phosphate dehydratase [Planctomycetota bacterium]